MGAKEPSVVNKKNLTRKKTIPTVQEVELRLLWIKVQRTKLLAPNKSAERWVVESAWAERTAISSNCKTDSFIEEHKLNHLQFFSSKF